MNKLRRLWGQENPGKVDLIVFCVLVGVSFFLWNHPDIEETARHTQILLDDMTSGRFLDFYQDTMEGRLVYGYANAAHYHIVFYLLCALWDLPLYLLSQVITVSDFAFVLWTKGIGVGAWLCSGILLGKVARRIGAPSNWSNWMPYCFWLCPISFFTVLAMGQYDSLCLLFILWALLFYLDDNIPAFVLVMGAALVFKMFALFLLIPLLLLREKRLSRLVGYGILSSWLYLPGTLLFLGRSGDAGYFNSLIAERLFTVEAPFAGGTSLFLMGLAILYALTFAWRPDDVQMLKAAVPYLCMAVFGWLFVCVDWHPQWLILLMPFLLLIMARSSHALWWAVLQVVLTAAFFVLIAYRFPGQLEANLFDFGVLGRCAGLLLSAQPAVRTNAIYFSLVPYLERLAPVGFSASLVAFLLGSFPVGKKTLEEYLNHQETPCAPSLYTWGCFAISWGIFWLAPTLYGWMRSFGW